MRTRMLGHSDFMSVQKQICESYILSGVSEENFYNENCEFRDKLGDKLSLFGKHADEFDALAGEGDGDFYIGESWTMNRTMCVDLMTERLATSEMINAVVSILQSKDQDWLVIVSCFEYSKMSDFFLLISKDEIVAWFESVKDQARFGM